MKQNTKCYPVHIIYQKIALEVVKNLLGFHAVTRCDIVSSFAGHGKKSCLAVFLHHPELCKGVVRDGAIAEVEQFVCNLYGAPDSGCDEARRAFFELGKLMESLSQPLTPRTIHFESQLPSQNMVSGRQMPQVTGKSSRLGRMGGNKWCLEDSVDQETLGARELSGTCLELVTCRCDNSQCRTLACKCVLSGQICLPMCGCAAHGCLSIFSVADS